jgi:hypothetical protein
MGSDRFEVDRKERDRLKLLREASKGQTTQQAGEELGLCER